MPPRYVYTSTELLSLGTVVVSQTLRDATGWVHCGINYSSWACASWVVWYKKAQYGQGLYEGEHENGAVQGLRLRLAHLISFPYHFLGNA